MRVGISGTRRGPTPEQEAVLRSVLGSEHVTRLVHGGCVGVDEEADGLYREVQKCPVVSVYPAIGGKGHYAPPDYRDIERPPLERNRLIVQEAELMVIVPAQNRVLPRGSGTWATYRYAKAANVLTIVIFRDGSTGLHA